MHSEIAALQVKSEWQARQPNKRAHVRRRRGQHGSPSRAHAVLESHSVDHRLIGGDELRIYSPCRPSRIPPRMMMFHRKRIAGRAGSRYQTLVLSTRLRTAGLPMRSRSACCPPRGDPLRSRGLHTCVSSSRSRSVDTLQVSCGRRADVDASIDHRIFVDAAFLPAPSTAAEHAEKPRMPVGALQRSPKEDVLASRRYPPSFGREAAQPTHRGVPA